MSNDVVVSAEEERLLKDTEKRAIDIEKRGMDERIRYVMMVMRVRIISLF